VKSRLTALVAPMVLMLVCGTAFSSGAPWFRWKNKVNKTIMCAKTTPGDVWVVMDGPYMESRCKKPGNPQ